MTGTGYTPDADPLVEIERLKLAVRVERERRVMAALWGSLDDECPSAFSLYRRTEDTPDGERGGVLAYGVQWADATVTVRWTHTTNRSGVPTDTYTMRTFDSLTDLQDRLADGVTLVWLSEDIDDLRKAITAGVEHDMRQRARTDTVRDAVARALLYAEPVTLTWPQCLNLANVTLITLFDKGES